VEHQPAASIFLVLQESALGHAMRSSPALYPAVEILHIFGFVVLVGLILALDLSLKYDPSRISIVAVEPAGIGSGLNVAHGDQGDAHKISAYGVLPLSGSGSVLRITIEALNPTGVRVPLTVNGTANEGRIPLRLGAQKASAPAVSR
jgi:hypothetical protein